MSRLTLQRILLTTSLGLLGCHHSPKVWTLTPPSPPSGQPKVFDLTWQPPSVDPNGLPLNPVWGSQSWTTGAMLPPAQQAACRADPRQCTGQRVVEDWAPSPSLCRFGVDTGFGGAGPIAAHFDWTIATYTGFVRPSFPAISEDNDYNFIFQPGDPQEIAGITESNAIVPFDASKRYIELELLSTEVDQRFTLPWWKDFASDADRVLSADDQEAQDRIDAAWAPAGRPRRAVVVGLFGVDCEHGCRSELHPVYVLMVETDPNPAHNVWQLFARNWGTGGSCSTLNHEFKSATSTLAVQVPPPAPGVSVDHLVDATFARSDDTIAPPSFSRPAHGDGLMVTLGVVPPQVRGLEELALTIQWAGATPSAPTPAPPVAEMRSAQPPRPPTVSSIPKRQTESAYILSSVDALPAAEREAVRRDLIQALARPRRTLERDRLSSGVDLTIRPGSATAATHVPAAAPPAQPPGSPNRLQDVSTDRSRVVWSRLCAAYQGHLPPYNGQDISGICRQPGATWKGK